MEITQEQLKKILHYDPETGIFRWRYSVAKRVKPWDVAGSKNSQGYILFKLNNQGFKAHRLAWLYMTGVWPKDNIDHKDMDKSNNSWGNLREATSKQNQENIPLRKNNSSGFRGVSWYGPLQKWAAYIRHNKKKVHFGYFKTAEEAAQVAAAKRAELFTHDTGRDKVRAV
jgi:hypothetical protein